VTTARLLWRLLPLPLSTSLVLLAPQIRQPLALVIRVLALSPRDLARLQTAANPLLQDQPCLLPVTELRSE
jgi:hypothetical protein